MRTTCTGRDSWVPVSGAGNLGLAFRTRHRQEQHLLSRCRLGDRELPVRDLCGVTCQHRHRLQQLGRRQRRVARRCELPHELHGLPEPCPSDSRRGATRRTRSTSIRNSCCPSPICSCRARAPRGKPGPISAASVGRPRRTTTAVTSRPLPRVRLGPPGTGAWGPISSARGRPTPDARQSPAYTDAWCTSVVAFPSFPYSSRR